MSLLKALNSNSLYLLRPGWLFNSGLGLNNSNKQNTLENISTRLNSQSSVQAQKKEDVHTSSALQGKTLVTSSNRDYTQNTQSKQKSELSQNVQKAVAADDNKPAAKTEQQIRQLSQETRSTNISGNRSDTVATTRDTQKMGKEQVTRTHYDSQGQGDQTTDTQLNRVTNTDSKYKIYDQNGKVVGESTGQQTVTVDQNVSSDRQWESTGSRDIQQNTLFTELKAGDTTLRSTKTNSTDTSEGHQVINTDTTSTITTQVDKSDAEGTLLSTRKYGQNVNTVDERTIDTQRSTESQQESRVISRPGIVESHSESQYETNATTDDQTETTGIIQDLDGEGNLVKERTYERNVNTVTDENREGSNHTWTTTEKADGNTITTMNVDADEKARVNTVSISEQDGLQTVRNINTRSDIETIGEVETRTAADGSRTVEIEAEQTRNTTTHDLTVGPTAQGRLVETDTWSSQGVAGTMNFNPDTNQVESSKSAVPGSVVIEVGSNTGVRASFKLENGNLTFDFTAHKMSSTDQQTITGKVNAEGETPVQGSVSQQLKETDEEIHFTGQVVSSTDENGNRVFTLQGKITDQGDGALVLNNMQGFQSEQSTAEIDVDAKLTVSRETVVNGDTTTTKSSATAEMNLNRVENTVDEGVNVKTITPLNTSDGFNAGLVANNGSLQFNFGVFNVGLRFSA